MRQKKGNSFRIKKKGENSLNFCDKYFISNIKCDMNCFITMRNYVDEDDNDDETKCLGYLV